MKINCSTPVDVSKIAKNLPQRKLVSFSGNMNPSEIREKKTSSKKKSPVLSTIKGIFALLKYSITGKFDRTALEIAYDKNTPIGVTIKY